MPGERGGEGTTTHITIIFRAREYRRARPPKPQKAGALGGKIRQPHHPNDNQPHGGGGRGGRFLSPAQTTISWGARAGEGLRRAHDLPKLPKRQSAIAPRMEEATVWGGGWRQDGVPRRGLAPPCGKAVTGVAGRQGHIEGHAPPGPGGGGLCACWAAWRGTGSGPPRQEGGSGSVGSDDIDDDIRGASTWVWRDRAALWGWEVNGTVTCANCCLTLGYASDHDPVQGEPSVGVEPTGL